MPAAFKSAAVVVAHPDDETLFAGGFLARHGRKCTVICCTTPMRDPIRIDKFLDACKVYGAYAQPEAAMDAGPERPIQLNLNLEAFDLVLTHNRWGEYGHPHHVMVHQHVLKRAKCPVLVFGDERALRFKRNKLELRLTHREEVIRMEALQSYNHVLPYNGRDLPKWEALLERYGNLKAVEVFDAP